MAKNIALEVTLNGVQKSISSLQEFEKELQKLQDELGIVSQDSSTTFDQMSQDISQVNKDFDLLTQNMEDVDFTATVDQFTTVGDSITETFGSAQTAIQEFGNETDVVAMTSKKALEEVTKSSFSVSGSLTDMGEKFSQIPGPIGQVASSVKGLGQAFKILIANPVGLILAAIALVLTGLYKAFTSTKAGAEQLEQVFAGLGALVDILRDRFLKYVGAIKSLLTLDFQGFADGIKGAFGGIGTEIQKEVTQAMELKKTLQSITDQTRDLNKERARQNVLIAEAKLKINDETLSFQQRLEALQEVRKEEIRIVEVEERLAEARYEAIKAQNALSDSSAQALDEEASAYVDLQNKILASKLKQKELFDQEKALRDKQKAEQKAVDDERKRVDKEAFDRKKAQIEEIKKLATESLTLEIAALKLFRKEITQAVPEPQIIQSLTLIRDTQKDLVKQFEKPTFDSLLKEFRDVVPTFSEASDSIDKFGKLYDKAREELIKGSQSSVDEFEEISVNLSNAFTDAFLKGDITKPALDAFKELRDGYTALNKNINIDQPPLFDPVEYNKRLRDVQIVNGVIIQEIDENNELRRVKTKKSNFQALSDFEAFEKQISDSLVDYYKKNNKDVKALLNKGAKDEADKLIAELTQTYLDNLKITSNSITQTEQQITGFYGKTIKDQTERQKQETLATIGFIGNNVDIILKQLIETVGNVEGITEDAFKELVKQTLGTTEFTKEELQALEQIYEQFYEKLNKQRQDDVKKEKDAQKEKRETQLNNIESLSNELGNVSSLLSQFSQDSLERLAIEEEQALEGIIGTSEAANKKRIELAQQYEAKRLQIEKQTRIQELQFARVQAIAEGAVSVIRASANPILLPITIALVAGQVGLISQQIQTARSLQRGGKFNLGGKLEGPSHERGGIRLGQMGIELEGGESVINRVSSSQYSSLLSTINQAGGGRPLVSSQFDDSRLLEALAKQRSEPIRAYVLEQEITNKQAINTRLESLSTL
jgi:hypothetical protein